MKFQLITPTSLVLKKCPMCRYHKRHFKGITCPDCQTRRASLKIRDENQTLLSLLSTSLPNEKETSHALSGARLWERRA